MVYFWFNTSVTLFLQIHFVFMKREKHNSPLSVMSLSQLWFVSITCLSFFIWHLIRFPVYQNTHWFVVCQHYLPFFLQIFPPVPFIVSKSLICGNWYPVDQKGFAQCFSSEKGFGLILSIFCNFKKFFFRIKKLRWKILIYHYLSFEYNPLKSISIWTL